MSKLELQKRFKKENPNVFFTWATYTDWLEKRLEDAEVELKKVLKEHSLLLGLLCEIRLAYQGVGDFESTGENMVALIPRIDLMLGLKHPGTETPDQER